MKYLFLSILSVTFLSNTVFAQREPIFNEKKFDGLFFNHFTNQSDSLITILKTRKYYFYFLVQNKKIHTLTDTIPPEMISFFDQLNKNANHLFSKVDSGMFIFPISLGFKYKDSSVADIRIYLKDLDKFFSDFKNQNCYYKILGTQTFLFHYRLIVN